MVNASWLYLDFVANDCPHATDKHVLITWLLLNVGHVNKWAGGTDKQYQLLQHGLFFRKHEICLYVASFLKIERVQILEIFPRGRQEPVFHIYNIYFVAADVFATQAVAMILT